MSARQVAYMLWSLMGKKLQDLSWRGSARNIGIDGTDDDR